MRTKIIILVFLAQSTSLLAQNQLADAVYFSLEEAVLYTAMEHNLNAKNARVDVDAADKRVWGNRFATGLPQVNASVDYSYNINTCDYPDP